MEQAGDASGHISGQQGRVGSVETRLESTKHESAQGSNAALLIRGVLSEHLPSWAVTA